MPISSFNSEWIVDESRWGKPRIQVLEIRDREHPDGEPIAWLLVERQETYRRETPNGPAYEASIQLTYELVVEKYSIHEVAKGNFAGRYSLFTESGGEVSLSQGGTFLDLPGLTGQRIGTYLMNEVVTWAKRWPEASVNSVELMIGQGGDENKERRNHFWERFGLEFDYSDPEHRTGRSKPMLAKDLNQVEKWKENITELRVQDYLSELLYTRQQALWEVARLDSAFNDTRDELRKAEARPIRWALRELYCQYGGIMAGGALLAAFASVLWMRF